MTAQVGDKLILNDEKFHKDDHYPEINGVSPTLEPYDDSKMLKYMGHNFYKGINYSVSYSGLITCK